MVYVTTENSNYIIDCQFIPCVNWFKISIGSQYINISLSERWKKMSFGNRCTLSGGNGLVNLSVPIENGRDQKALFRDIKISYEDNWQLIFWRTLISCYNRSPFFEYYRDGFEEILFKKQVYLLDLNLELIQLCFKYLGNNKNVMLVDDNKYPQINSAENHLTPKTYLSVIHPVTYHQMFEDRFGFQPNLSIMDLLFMEGPEARYILGS